MSIDVRYEHRQVGYLILVISALSFGFLAWLAFWLPVADDPVSSIIIYGVLGVLVLMAIVFSSLRTRVTARDVQACFTFGPTKSFALTEIVSATAVCNPWYFGWGWRVWFWPYTVIYAVSGFTAVELMLKNGRRYRLGTDEPHALVDAIAQAQADAVSLNIAGGELEVFD